ncbi:S1C family serine protease [Luteipulveratus mongoliensis]|uniref:PDZ domain-containing protein n=1 Tax=Luteipulveratus mongoliensis TaxID=571913 RepID=A0A0K1JM22_9MICO|nr:trypsin-like peptidase domain-containing protein [Luteipulveratus mongoliensis]AKU17640.1 hypothetical protein VV02_20325 [Luteipulveratus mongoliensis]
MTEHGSSPAGGPPESTQPLDLERTETVRLTPGPGAGASPAGVRQPPPGLGAQQPYAPVSGPQPPHQGPGGPIPPYRPAGPPFGAPQLVPPGPPQPPRRRTGVLVASAIGLALLAGAAGGVSGYALGQQDDEPQTQASGSAGSGVAPIARSVLPSVVTLEVTDAGEDSGGTGSGFVTRQDGYIVTNNHVVQAGGDQGKIKVLFPDGSQVDGKLVGRDASYDLAVVKVNRTGLAAVTFGESKAVAVGDPVIAVGSPLGLDSTVTTGIISALNRPVSPGGSEDQRSYINAIQTDAAINPGNSGGPLLDGHGQVVGVNTAIARVPGSKATEGGNIGLGFAIPSDQARRTVDQLISKGKAEHPIIGAFVDSGYTGEGAKLAGSNGEPAVRAGGPAAKAGLKDGDIILKIDDLKVTSANQLIVTIRAKQVGDKVRLLVRSGGQQRTVDVTLEGATG